MKNWKNNVLLLSLFAGILFSHICNAEESTNLLSLQEGTIPVVTPKSYGGWEAEKLLDDSPRSGWACEKGNTRDNVFVFEMSAPAVIERFEFDNASIDSEAAGAGNIVVEVSGSSRDDGFTTVLTAVLADRLDGQNFVAASKLLARWVRLTIKDNQGSTDWTELFSFRGFGQKPPLSPPFDISGTFSTSYSNFHVRQQGTALTGCYEYDGGLLDGAIEGRVMKITWHESGGPDDRGPAVMVFSPDGKSFRGYWWHLNNEKEAPSGSWDGTKISSEVGSCPHWSGSVGGELKKKLSDEKRARLYGILFDLDSDVIRPESRPVLDEVLGLLKDEPDWDLTIEGHTDSTGSETYNEILSQNRANAVAAYLALGGIKAERLKAKGFGESHPVADNSTELGRAQNRRVELVRD